MNPLLRKIKTVTKNPFVLLEKSLYVCSPLISDRIYLKLLFPIKTGYFLNLDNPRTYNEKLQWLKLNYRKPLMSIMVDKFESKSYASNIIGKKHIIKTYGVWDSFNEIDFNLLPSSFVLKTTHDQGGVIVVDNKKNLKVTEAKNKLEKHLKKKHFYLSREWPYKNVKPRIMAEELLIPKEDEVLYDYKFFCFNGEPKIMYISYISDKYYMDYYDMNFKKLDIKRKGHSISNDTLSEPPQWELMKSLSRQLSQGFPHLRVDFYNLNNEVYLGELTFFQGGGMKAFYPRKWDTTLGDWICLPKIK